ncbi:MAG: adenosylcobinamide-GDP ribazoletransferase [Pseudomarimonas sp.]
MSRVRHQLRLFAVAVQFFTRLPVPQFKQFDPRWLSQSARYFPLVGLLVGAISAASLWLCGQWLPMPVASGLALGVSIMVTGAFHEDGLADTFDALGGSVPKERALEIMQDSRIGSYGAVAMAFGVGLRWVLLASLPLSLACLALLALHPAARGGSVTLMARLRYVRFDDSKAKPVAQDLAGLDLVVALLTAVLPALVITWFWPPLWLAMSAGLIGVGLVHLFCGRWFRQRIGGYTGDTLGCAEQLGEIAFLLGALVALPLLWA